MNGIDVLFAIVGLLLLVGAFEVWVWRERVEQRRFERRVRVNLWRATRRP